MDESHVCAGPLQFALVEIVIRAPVREPFALKTPPFATAAIETPKNWN
jgi:hypothetical protein